MPPKKGKGSTSNTAALAKAHLARVSAANEELRIKQEAEDARLKEIEDREAKITEATNTVAKINESRERESVMAELMSPLSKDKRELMNNLLESVSTSKLKAQFNKYLPTVLNESSTTIKSQKLNESQKTEITGNKAATTQATDSAAEIINLKKLAGIN